MQSLKTILRARLVPCLPVLAITGIVVTVSVQAGCSSSDEKCTSSRGGCRADPDDNQDDNEFLKRFSPFD